MLISTTCINVITGNRSRCCSVCKPDSTAGCITRCQVSQHVLISKKHRHVLLHSVSVLVAGNFSCYAPNLSCSFSHTSIVRKRILCPAGQISCSQTQRHFSLLLKAKDMTVMWRNPRCIKLQSLHKQQGSQGADMQNLAEQVMVEVVKDSFGGA